MTDIPYAELHAHSAYSFLDGASHPEELIAEAARLELSALALTDHNGLYGVVRFAEAGRRINFPTIFGAELTLEQPEVVTGTPDPQGKHLMVLARGVAGYRKLARAISQAHLATKEKGRVAFTVEDLAEQAGGDWLILTGCRKGLVPQALAKGIEPAEEELRNLRSLFGAENVAVELMDSHDPLDGKKWEQLQFLADELELPAVATGGVHHAQPQQHRLATALAALRARRSLDDMDGYLPAASRHLRSPAEMQRRFFQHPQALHTAHHLGKECAFDLSLVAPQLPPWPVPTGHDEMSWLRELVRREALHRYGPPEAPWVPGAYQKLAHELDIIEHLGFAGYFLIVHDIVDQCRQRGILCQGRGSAANSAVCFALGITAVDAVRHGLLFERFLSPERDGPPDIDVDIEAKRREEIIQYVYQRYGRTHAAQVANVITYRPRSAIRDAARALGHDVGRQDAWSKNIERWSPLEQHQEEKEIPASVLDLARELERLPRHLGIHTGGMVICDRPIIEVCPVEWARMEGRTVLQWDKDDCADAGLVKFDLLGLGMLTALRIAFDFIAEHEGKSFDLASIPQEDPAVYDLLCAADTVGVFQVESRAQMASLPRLRPRCFYDIVVQVALIRPGPIQGGSVHPYIRRVRGQEPITYLHPLLRSALEKTKGIPLFQEQLMQMAVDVAGFTAAEADQLRRAMGSKRSIERMEELRERLFSGMAQRGITGEVAEEIFTKLQGFSDFGFPESHAFSFAYLVYASAWLKVHHPAPFYAALLAAQPMGFYSPQSLVADARRHGITTLRPCVEHSEEKATVTQLKNGELGVRMGLSSVKGMGEEPAKTIVAERQRNPFRDAIDLARRTGVTRSHLEALATAGALETFGISRREALWQAGAAAQETPDRLPGTAVGVHAPMLPGMSDLERDVADMWATGVSPTTYPTEHRREELQARGILRVVDAMGVESGRRVKVAGVVTHRQRPATAVGVTFLSVEDETGLLNVVCSTGFWARFRQIARGSRAVVVRGIVESADDAVNLVADHIEAFDLYVAGKSRDFR